MYNVVFLSTLLSKMGKLKQTHSCGSGEAAASCSQAAALSSLPSHHAMPSPAPATNTVPTSAKWENIFYCPQTTLLTNYHLILRILVAWET